jgi:hypothetical protein
MLPRLSVIGPVKQPRVPDWIVVSRFSRPPPQKAYGAKYVVIQSDADSISNFDDSGPRIVSDFKLRADLHGHDLFCPECTKAIRALHAGIFTRTGSMDHKFGPMGRNFRQFNRLALGKIDIPKIVLHSKEHG